jgi:hypothetical protein
MKRLTLALGAFVAAGLLAQTASANANVAGRCSIAGLATFGPTNLKVLPTPKLGYEFEGSAVCETVPMKEVRTGSVEVRGEDTLSCFGSLGSEESQGTLTLAGIKFPFGLTFLSAGPGSAGVSVKFADGGVAVGTATFLASRGEPAEECFASTGARALEFKAVAVGEF